MVGFLRAGIDAGPAARAFPILPHENGLRLESLGVLAPAAS
jgi:hypothetical protein